MQPPKLALVCLGSKTRDGSYGTREKKPHYSTSIYLFLVILILIISSIINYKVSILKTSTNKIPKKLIFYLSISFNLRTGIKEKPVNNNRYN